MGDTNYTLISLSKEKSLTPNIGWNGRKYYLTLLLCRHIIESAKVYKHSVRNLFNLKADNSCGTPANA
jgi:hypothetical protein